MKRSFQLAIAFIALVFAAALTSNMAAASGQPMMSVAPSHVGQDTVPVLDQLAATIEIQINPGKIIQITPGKKVKKKLKVKVRDCPAGQNRDPKTGVCFSCSHNDHFENGKCVPCKPGFHEADVTDDNGEVNRECVPNGKKTNSKTQTKKSCPEGTEFKNGKCQKRKSEFPEVEQCPEGQNPDPNTGVCFSCSHNDHFDPAQGKCVPCKQGFHVEGDQCVAD